MLQKCITAIKTEQENINKEFPKYESLTNSIFTEITEFANEDFDGITDNKRFRYFLDLCKNILTTAFEQDTQKAYLRMVFKALKNEDISKYFSKEMQSKSSDVLMLIDGLASKFTESWQGMVPYDKNEQLNRLLKYLDVFKKTKYDIKEIKKLI